MDGTQVAHEHVCGFVASLCFVSVVFLSLMVVCICLPPFSR